MFPTVYIVMKPHFNGTFPLEIRRVLENGEILDSIPFSLEEGALDSIEQMEIASETSEIFGFEILDER